MFHTFTGRTGVRRAAGCGLSLALGLAAASLLLVLARTGTARAAPTASIIIVNPGDSIQAAISNAVAGDTILINAGTYTESLTLNKAISLTGVASNTVILHAIASQRVLTVTGSTINNSVVISGLTFTGGDMPGPGVYPANCGGGVELTGSAQPLLANVIVTGNTAGAGGGLCAVFPSALSLAGSQVLSNTAANDWGGGIYSSYPATLSGVWLQGNQCLGAGCFGGGVATSLALTLTNTTLISNTSQGDGGGARSQAEMVVSGGLVAGNVCAEAGCAGGGLASNTTLSLTGTQFISNTAGGAAGGLLASGAATVSGALFQDNSCTQNPCDGGGLFAGSALTMNSSQVLSNSALRFGGGVRVDGAATVNTVVFQNNACTQAGCQGGGLWAVGPLSATATQFTSNTSTSSGGALYDFGAGTLSGGAFQNNQCTQSGCLGGALLANGTMALTGTQFLSNTAQNDGGGLYVFGALALTNTQFLSNTAPNFGGGAYAGGATTVSGGLFENNQCTTTAGCEGGGLYADTLTLTGTQFISNTAHREGGGVYVNHLSTLTNALFENNACGQNVSASCEGGGLWSGFGVTLSNTDFLSNTAQSRGGGVYANLAAGINGGEFLNNTCTNTDCLGGALLAGSNLALTGTQFISNSAGEEGGALEAIGPLTVTDGLFQRNACTQVGCEAGALRAEGGLVSGTQFLTNTARMGGGGVVASGAITFTNNIFQGNTCTQAACDGGALLVDNASLSGTNFIHNSAQGDGGALRGNQAVTLANGLFQSNQCLTDGCGGGGLHVDGSLALSGTQFISNTAHLQGGAAYVGTTANLTNGLFNGNACTQTDCLGGALYVFQTGPVSLSNTSFNNNRSLASGGALRSAGDTALSGGQVANNQCSQTNCSGGGLYVAGGLTLSGMQISNSQSGSDGAGAYATGALTDTNSLLQNNQCTQAGCRGGGLFAGGALALTGTQLNNNTSGSGGAGAFSTGPATLSGGQFQANACTQTNCFGGGLYAQSALSVTTTSFNGNTAHDDGGGVWAGGDAVVDNGLFQNNACTQDNCRGGGLNAVQGLTLTGTQFLTNTARAGAGGAFGNVGAADRVNNGLFLNNRCTQALCEGGGLDVISALALTGTQFLNNTTTSSGGGLYSGGPATLDRAAFFNNTAVLGGGLYHGGTGGHVINSVFGNNVATTSGGAIFINTTGGTFILEQDTIGMPSFDVPTSSVQLLTGNVGITNTIFIFYDFGINSGNGTVYEDYNLFDHVSHPTVGNVVSGGHSFNGAARPANPVFGNYRLLPGSAAIDAGVNDGVTIDFDGQARPHGRGYDIGYDEAYLDELYLPLLKR